MVWGLINLNPVLIFWIRYGNFRSDEWKGDRSFLLFEDKGRLRVPHNTITRRLLTGQAITSEPEPACHWEEPSREFVTAPRPIQLLDRSQLPSSTEDTLAQSKWSNSHHFHWRQIAMLILRTVGSRFVFFKSVVLTAPQHFMDCTRFALKGFCSRQCYGVYLNLLAMVYRHIWLQQDTRYYWQHLYGQTSKK